MLVLVHGVAVIFLLPLLRTIDALERNCLEQHAVLLRFLQTDSRILKAKCEATGVLRSGALTCHVGDDA